MKYKKFLAMLLCGVFLLAGCGGDNGEDEDGEERRGLGGLGGLLVAHEEEDPYPLDVKIAFIYSGAVGSDTLIEHFELTRGELERTLGVETCYIDNVRLQQFPEAVEIAVDAGCNIIVAASYSYGSSVVLAARRFHEISFISFGNTDTAHNLSNVQPLLYQAAHVNGIIAGWNTDSNKIGVVADINMYNAHGIVNAFALGVRDITYAQIDFSINWALSQNFADTRAAIDDLISQGCDIIFIYQSEEYGFRRCEELGIRVQGFACNVPELAPENFLTGMYLNMNTYFIDKVRTVMYGNYHGDLTRRGLNHGMAGMIGLNPDKVKGGTRDLADALIEYISQDLKPVFGGEIRDMNNDVRVPRGNALQAPQILTLRWLANSFVSETNMSASLTDEDIIFSDLVIRN